MTNFFITNQEDTLDKNEHMPLYDFLELYESVKPNQLFAKIYFNHSNSENKFSSFVSQLRFGDWRKGLSINLGVDLVSIKNDSTQNLNIINNMTQNFLDDYIFNKCLVNDNSTFYFQINPKNYFTLINYCHTKMGEINLETLKKIKNFNYSQNEIDFSLRSLSSYSMYISNDTHSEIINTFVEHNVVPKKIPSLSVDIKTLNTKILNRPDAFNILSQLKFFIKQNSFSNISMENNLKFIQHINKKLDKEILNFNSDEKNTLFTKSFISFCKKHKSHLFSKDLSVYPDYANFYSNVKKLSQQYPDINEQISNITQLFKEKDTGIDFTSMGSYSNNELAVEALILDFQILRSLSSLAIFNKIKPHANNILDLIIKESGYKVILPFTHISKGIYTAVIQQTHPNSNQKEIWESFDYVVNYFLLNQNNIEYNEKIIQSLILQKKIEYSLEDEEQTSNKPQPVNKF